MKTQEEKLKFLNDTIEYYKTNTRGIKKISESTVICSYENGCAIGRHLDVELSKLLDKESNTSISISNVFRQLPDELKNYGKDFLLSVQELHDFNTNWILNKEGGNDLTEVGKERYENILKGLSINTI